MNLKDGSPHIFGLPWQNQEQIIPKLEEMLNLYPKKNLCIIWDNAGFHRGKELRSHLGKGNKLERIRLINLPPYAPDKNPQEFIWRYAKDGIGNQIYNKFRDLIATFENIVMGRKYHYKF